MKRKIYLMLGSVLVFSLIFAGLLQWKGRQTIAASMISEEKQNELEEIPCYEETAELKLLFQGREVPYDRNREVYYLPQTSEGSWMRRSEFSVSEESARLFWCEDEMWSDLEAAISQGHAFSFFISDGVFAKKGKIVFIGLPMITLDTIQSIDEENTYCKVTVFDPFHNKNGIYETNSCNGYLRLRGKTSKLFPKQGFNLDLVKASQEPYKTNLFGLREDDDWKLNALYPDATKVREAVAMELWNELAAQTESIHDTGTKMEYFEMLIDGDYRGLYGAMEQLDFKQFSLDKSEDVIYKGYAWPLEGNIDESTINVTGDIYGHWIKTGEQPVREALWKPFVEYVNAANFAEQQEFCDTEKFYEYVQKHMDVDNFLNLELYVQMLYAFDNKYKNLYIATDIRDDGDYTMVRIPWDLNYSFGDRYSIENAALTKYDLEWARELMPHFMMSETLLEAQNQEFARILNEKWEVLKNTTFQTAHVRALAERYLEMLTSSGAFERDAKRWPDGPHDPSLDQLLEFHETRLEFLDEHYQSFLNE